ncbi:MAG: hypothetical protein SGI72_04805 [Planctomycetota bacterium]|nr:hypothetical protein [Planctomycetota bacterium]
MSTTRWFAGLLLVALAPAREMASKRAAWTEVDTRIFPSTWILPGDLWRPANAASNLPERWLEIVETRFDAPADAQWMASVGDIVLEHRRRGGTRAALDALLAQLKTSRPKTHERVADVLSEVLVSDAIRSKKWDPEDDRRDDGVYFGPFLERNKTRTSPWSDQSGTTHFHQAITFVRADLDAIVGALHDYASTMRDPGTSYEKMDPRADSIVFGEDEQTGPFAALRVAIRADLPFPFSHYDLDLGILHRLDAAKHFVTYVFSPSKDFYWLAGQDFHCPVSTAAGEWVGTLIVRISGFDLRGVPDDDDARKSGSRSALGNLRRRAEAAFVASGGVPRTIDGAIPKLTVLAN